MCKFSSKSRGVPFQISFFWGDLTRNDPIVIMTYVLYYKQSIIKGTDHAGTFMSLKCVVYYANYRSWHQSSKI